MARLAIGRGFLAEYGRLDKDVQVAVDAAITRFARHPQPGIQLEKPQRSWDDRIRTLKVDSHWHGVVLAPATGDTYCLITILPRDKATAYATSHRFSVNPALGVLEVRDEDAIKQSHPALAEAARPDHKRLFADVGDADLTRLGVDAQLLPVIRLMTSEADLETRQEALPEAQYAALHALACGMTVDEAAREVARLYSADAPPGRVDPDDLVSAMERSPGQVTFVSGHEELQLILAHPFSAWRMFLHPSQRKIAYRASYSGPVQVTGGPGTGKTVTLLHRAAFLAARGDAAPAAADAPAGGLPAAGLPAGAAEGAARPRLLVTTFNGTLADALGTQLDLLVKDEAVRRRIEVLNVDRLAYRIVKAARGAPVIADERALRARWAAAAAAAGLDFSPAFLKNEWEQVILAQDLRTEQAYLTCLRTGRGKPLTKQQRSQVWQAAQRVTAELAAARQSTHMQLANEAAHLLRQAGTPLYQHVLVDEAQDLHPSQWRLLREAVAPGPDDLFIVADPHQRIYDNRVSLVSMRISVRGRSLRLSLSYRTTQEVLNWAIPLLGTEPVTGLDGEADSLAGYRSPMRGPSPRYRMAATRDAEFAALAAQVSAWVAAGMEPHAIGVTARSASLVREARERLKESGIMTIPLSGRENAQAARAGTMHAMKGLEFQAVAVIGVERGLVPEPTTITPESEDPVVYAQDLQRERCLLFVACTRARDYLYVSGTGEPSEFMPAAQPGSRDGAAPAARVPGPERLPDALPAVTMGELLWSREDSWRPLLRSVSLIAEADLRPDHARQVAVALGRLYANLRHPRSEGDSLLSRWPACLVAAMAAVAAADDGSGTYWDALWQATRLPGSADDAVTWGRAFNTAVSRLGMAVFPELPPHSAGPVLMHAGVPAHCLGGYFRALLSRLQLDPGTDADAFLSWAAGPGPGPAQLAGPAREFLRDGGGYARDFVDRTLDLLGRLAEQETDVSAVMLPRYVVEAAEKELADGDLDLSWAGGRRPGGAGTARPGQPDRPRIALDPYGQGVHLVLPAGGALADGAFWRVTADGATRLVPPEQGSPARGREHDAAAHAAVPLRPAGTVLVTPVGSAGHPAAGHPAAGHPAAGHPAELSVIDPADPVLFFSAGGRLLASGTPLPRDPVWVIYPAGREPEFAGQPAYLAGPDVPAGWDGWLLRCVSLENVQAVRLPGCRSHAVEVRAQPRLVLADPLPGVTAPCGSPVYPAPPRLRLPQDLGANIRWHAEVRRADGGASACSAVGPADDIDLWAGIPRPALGAFEVTVRGTLGRRLRRTIFVAEGLSVTCQPPARPLTGAGLAVATARLAASGDEGSCRPAALQFGPREATHVAEYRTGTAAESLAVTPPHAAVLCPGAGAATWTTSQVHLVAEDFATAGRLLVRMPPALRRGHPGAGGGAGLPELAVLARGRTAQAIEATALPVPGLFEFDLARAAGVIAESGRAELAVSDGGALMPVGHVRPRRAAPGVESIFNGPCCSQYR